LYFRRGHAVFPALAAALHVHRQTTLVAGGLDGQSGLVLGLQTPTKSRLGLGTVNKVNLQDCLFGISGYGMDMYGLIERNIYCHIKCYSNGMIPQV
jgi:hypothetical protein